MARNNELDLNHIWLLALFHYILGGLEAAFGCLPLIYVGMGIAFVTGEFDKGPNPPPPQVGYVLIFVGLFVTLLMWGMACLKLCAGRSLSQHKRYTFCFIIACLECLNTPTGTILGVFTIIVLSRPTVKALFAGEPMHDRRLDDFDRDYPDDRLPAPPAKPDDGTFREPK